MNSTSVEIFGRAARAPARKKVVRRWLIAKLNQIQFDPMPPVRT